MSVLRAVVFDVDGTLVDSERDGHRVAFNSAFAEAGLTDRWDVPTYRRLLEVTGGRRRLTTWFREQGRAAAEADALAAGLHHRKTVHVTRMAQEGLIRPRPGAIRLVTELRDAGIAVHVATTGTRAWVQPLLHGIFGPVFGEVVTGEDVGGLKPDPDAYLEVLARTGLAADEVVAVEDSHAGVRAAVAAGLTCLATTNEFTRHHDLRGARLVTDGLDDPSLVAWFHARIRRLTPGGEREG